jgi:serine/threonine-protein kinase RsbW
VAANLQNLSRIRRFVAEQGAALGAALDAVDDMILAVDEIATNSVVHGYGNLDLDASVEGKAEIEVEVRREGGALVVCLRDEADLFDPRDVPPPDLSLPLEQRPLGGMGVYLVNQLVDELTHAARPQGGNELTLTIRAAIERPDSDKQ